MTGPAGGFGREAAAPLTMLALIAAVAGADGAVWTAAAVAVVRRPA